MAEVGDYVSSRFYSFSLVPEVIIELFGQRTTKELQRCRMLAAFQNNLALLSCFYPGLLQRNLAYMLPTLTSLRGLGLFPINSRNSRLKNKSGKIYSMLSTSEFFLSVGR